MACGIYEPTYGKVDDLRPEELGFPDARRIMIRCRQKYITLLHDFPLRTHA